MKNLDFDLTSFIKFLINPVEEKNRLTFAANSLEIEREISLIFYSLLNFSTDVLCVIQSFSTFLGLESK